MHNAFASGRFSPTDDNAACVERRYGLSPVQARDELFNVMREIGHGRVENLAVSAGEPHLTAKTKLFQRYRPGGAPTQPPRRPFTSTRKPHAQHLKLAEHCRAVGDGVIDK